MTAVYTISVNQTLHNSRQLLQLLVTLLSVHAAQHSFMTLHQLLPYLVAFWSTCCLLCHLQKPFDGAMYNMMGSPYAMLESDVMVYAQPYKVHVISVEC